MSKIAVRLKDRQTGKITTTLIEASNHREAKDIAREKYGMAYEIL